MADSTMDLGASIRKQIEEADPDLLRELLQATVEALMGAKVDARAGAPW